MRIVGKKHGQSAVATIVLRVLRVDPDRIGIVRIPKGYISLAPNLLHRSKPLCSKTHSSVSASCANAFFAIV